MAAGLGFKTFANGDVLTANDTNGYLMQGVLVFASAAARDSAITSPQEGQFAYLKDTNVTTYYTGSAWANLDTTGMTNPMTTTGDTIYSSSGSTPARLGIGSTGQVLTVAGGVPTWATSSGSRGLNQIIPSSVSVGSGTASVGANGKITLTSVGTNISINGVFSSTYTNYHIVYDLISASSHTALNMRLRASGTDNTTATSYKTGGLDSSIPFAASGLSSQTSDSDKFSKLGWVGSVSINGGAFDIFQPFIAAKTTYVGSHFGNAAGDWYYSAGGGSHTQATSYDGFSLLTTQSLTGAIYIYGWQE
jgi:hypothetical protein